MLSREPPTTANFISLSCTPHRHLVTHTFHFPSSLSVTALVTFLPLSGKGEKKNAGAPAEGWCESHVMLCSSSVHVPWPLSSPQRAPCFGQEPRAALCRNKEHSISRAKKPQLLKKLVGHRNHPHGWLLQKWPWDTFL